MTPDPPRDDKIRITLDDLAAAPEREQPAGYGTVAQEPAAAAAEESKGSIVMKAWFYLGFAGLLGALLAWAICEPKFLDGGRNTWANLLMFPLMLAFMCIGFGVAEALVERSPRKGVVRGLLSLGLGIVLGFIFFFIANIIYNIGLSILFQAGGFSERSPGLWVVRGIAWMGFGVAGGIVYGIVGQSGKKCLYGIAGGVLGAGIGGAVFDPISIAVGHAGASRAVGMALFGAATGVAMGLVESALKDRWLYVSAGPLAGKQFILYKPLTAIGSDQNCDIYLFKDPAVLPRHASIEFRGTRAVVRASGPVEVQGRRAAETYLQSGDAIKIGRYTFLYRERERGPR